MFLVSICLSLSVILLSLGLIFPSTIGSSPHSADAVRGKATAALVNGILVSFSVCMSVIMFAFTGYHLSLICTGLTTKEHLKKRAAHSRKSCVQRLCGCASIPSSLQPRKLVFTNARGKIVNYGGLDESPSDESISGSDGENENDVEKCAARDGSSPPIITLDKL